MSKSWKMLIGLMAVTAATAAVAQAGGIVVVKGDMRKKQAETGTATLQCVVDVTDDPRPANEQQDGAGNYIPPEFVWSVPAPADVPSFPAGQPLLDSLSITETGTSGAGSQYSSTADLEAISAAAPPVIDEVQYLIPVTVTVTWTQSDGTVVSVPYNQNMPLVVNKWPGDDFLDNGITAVGNGVPEQTVVNIWNRTLGGQTAPNNGCATGDDAWGGGIWPFTIHSGRNGRCETKVNPPAAACPPGQVDQQVVPFGNGARFDAVGNEFRCINPNFPPPATANGWLDTVTLCGDDINKGGNVGIYVGPNGLCDTAPNK